MSSASTQDATPLAYADKPDMYYAGARHDFIALLPANPRATILEIGCGAGATAAAAFAAGRCAKFVGIELMADAAAKARAITPDIIVGNIEHIDLEFPDETFDALIMSEVLEHLAWPSKALTKIHPKMKPGAIVLASSPNIAHWKLIRDLARGRFDATEFGVMDRTHLRWFTPTSYAALFTDAGYEVLDIRPIRPLKGSKKLLAGVTRRPWLFWPQICITARRPLSR